MKVEELLRGRIDLKKIKPGYFFFGQSLFPAEFFLNRLKEELEKNTGSEIEVVRFYMDESNWSQVIDAARQGPTFFSPWRLISVRLPEKKSQRGQSYKDGSRTSQTMTGEEAGPSFDLENETAEEPAELDSEEAATDVEEPRTGLLSPADREAIKNYFSSPQAKTSLFIFRPGRFKETEPVARFFKSLQQSGVESVELRQLYEREALGWAAELARRFNKTMSEAAKKKLVEVVGTDLNLIFNEIQKLAAFVGERNRIEEEDVNEVTAWLKVFESYELENVLLSGRYEEAILLLHKLFEEGLRPELMIGYFTNFFKKLILARLWLREKKKTRDEIFQELYPGIKPLFYSLYQKKLGEFFSCLEAVKFEKLVRLVEELLNIDTRIKTSEAEAIFLLEVFLKSYYQTAE